MTDSELHEFRRHKWRLDGRPLRTIEDAREFLESVGFCLMYPISPEDPARRGGTEIVLPTFIGAWAGGEEILPTRQKAFSDPRAREATDLAVRLLRERSAYEASVFGEDNFLVASSVFPYFYALAGHRNPRQEPGSDRSLSPLAQDVLGAIQRAGPVTKRRLAKTLGGDLSEAAIDRALAELAAGLRITRVDYNPREGSAWDVLYRWSPAAVNAGMHLSVAVALSALLSKYLDCVIAADEKKIFDFFSPLIARSKVKEALNALLAARELEFVRVGKHTLVQIAPARSTERPRNSPPPRMSTHKKLVIAIDGPAGAGKSTLAARLARKLGYVNLESGAMYRALALKALARGVTLEDEAALLALAEGSRIELEPEGDGNRVLLDGGDISQRIREQDVTDAASKLSVHPRVRAWMVARQREMGAQGGIIMEGRDIGTQVFPDAEVKIFLDAAPEVRGDRRFRQTPSLPPEAVIAELRERDRRDRTRATSPLVPAPDAVVIDSTNMTIEQVIARAGDVISARQKQKAATD